MQDGRKEPVVDVVGAPFGEADGNHLLGGHLQVCSDGDNRGRDVSRFCVRASRQIVGRVPLLPGSKLIDVSQRDEYRRQDSIGFLLEEISQVIQQFAIGSTSG